MIEGILGIAGMFCISGIFWYGIFYRKEKKLLTRLQQMLDRAIDGKLQRTEISEEKYSALENSMKQYPDNNFLAGKNQQEQKEVIQRLISDIAHQTLTPISNLKIYGEILSEAESENREEIDTILEQTEKLDFLIQSLVKLSRMESGIIAVHPAEIRVRQLLQTIQQEFAAKTSEKNIVLSVCDTDDVIDDGIGMEKEEIPRIFGRFYRGMSVTDQPGVGIGLFLTREIVQAQKGYVKVKSEIGKGSMFSVFLPVSKNESYQNCDISETG